MFRFPAENRGVTVSERLLVDAKNPVSCKEHTTHCRAPPGDSRAGVYRAPARPASKFGPVAVERGRWPVRRLPSRPENGKEIARASLGTSSAAVRRARSPFSPSCSPGPTSTGRKPFARRIGRQPRCNEPDPLRDTARAVTWQEPYS